MVAIRAVPCGCYLTVPLPPVCNIPGFVMAAVIGDGNKPRIVILGGEEIN